MCLVDGILKKYFYVWQSPITGAVGRYANDGRLDKVMEATEEETEHPARSDDPNG